MRLLACLLAATMLSVAPAHAGEQAVTAPAAQAQAKALDFERVFASPSLNGAVPRGVKLSPDGRWLTLLRNRPDDRERYDLWGFDRRNGKWTMLVDSLKLSSGKELSEAEKMQRERLRIGDLKGIVTYEWSADSQSILVPLDGDLYLARLDGKVTRLTDSAGDELNPALSPKGGYVSFVRERRLWSGKVGAEPAAVTPNEAAETVHWGEAEFVAQEEMARLTGYWWAPDDSRIAVQRFDDAPVGLVTRTAIGAEGTKTYIQRYPVAGSPNSLVSLFVMKPDGTGRVEVDLGPDRDIYLARVDWAPDGKVLYVQRQNREQTVLDLLAVDPLTGKSRVVFSEKAADKSWINLTYNYRFLKDGSLVWWSERDGYGHLWLYRPKRHFDSQWLQLTKGEWVVTGLVGVDEKSGRVYFTGTKDDRLAINVYALNLANPAKIERLGEPGFVHAASMDKSGQTLLITRSSPTQPPQVFVADSKGQRLAWVEENRLDAGHPYAPFLPAHRTPTFGTIKASDGTVLHWRMITPVMEPGKRYPVFFEHYGGPGSQQVTRAWGGGLEQAIVAKGYIHFRIDNRGSDNRGVAFESHLYRAMGGVEVEDQKAGALYLKDLPQVDPAKIATYGWSYGGYMTIKMLQADPGLYAAGISGAPVTKWELYDTHYTERFMGNPNKVPAAYAKANALDDAGKIQDPMLLIHGMADDNVVFENSSMLISRMQAQAVPFEMMLYPGYTHRVGGPKVGPHMWNTIFAFLAKHGVTAPE
ncbi:MAG: prolyl oligopeptidase family serine peptidase [Sphingomonadaceae bacterium]|nr:prolyl oligopeptidase family serine peptidase [Sphingomonadaceae bacterium]